MPSGDGDVVRDLPDHWERGEFAARRPAAYAAAGLER
jgi:hypothetical protein